MMTPLARKLNSLNTKLEAWGKKCKVVAAAIATAAVVAHYWNWHYEKVQRNDSALTGFEFMQEQLQGHPEVFYSGSKKCPNVCLFLKDQIGVIFWHNLAAWPVYVRNYNILAF